MLHSLAGGPCRSQDGNSLHLSLQADAVAAWHFASNAHSLVRYFRRPSISELISVFSTHVPLFLHLSRAIFFSANALAFPRSWNALASDGRKDDSYDAQRAQTKNSAASTRPNSTLSTKEINEVAQNVSKPANSPKETSKACSPFPNAILRFPTVLA